MTDIQIAYHSSTWGRDGFLECLGDLDDLGFRYIETPGDIARHFYDKLYRFRNLLHDRGLRLAAMRGRGSLIDAETRDREIGFNKMICEFLKSNDGKVFVISGNVRPPGGPTDDHFKKLADFCNEIGEFCQHLQMKACIHTALGSVVETQADVERIMQLTEPGLLYLCPDTGHLTRAGADPLRLINVYIERIAHIYFKDVDTHEITDPEAEEHNAESDFVELGRGCVDFPAIIETLRNAGYRGTITIELEKTRRTPEESAKISKQYMEGTLGIPVSPRPIPDISESAPAPDEKTKPPARKPEPEPESEPEPTSGTRPPEPVAEQPPSERPLPPEEQPPAQLPAETPPPAPVQIQHSNDNDQDNDTQQENPEDLRG